MRQRVMIAMAIACSSLILADEPTTALDVTIGAHILELLAGRIEAEMGMAMVTRSRPHRRARTRSRSCMPGGSWNRRYRRALRQSPASLYERARVPSRKPGEAGASGRSPGTGAGERPWRCRTTAAMRHQTNGTMGGRRSSRRSSPAIW